jgi:hypothetical protein
LRFAPGDATDLAATVEQLLAEPAALGPMRQSARQEYEQNYTVESNYRFLMAIYQRVLGEAIEVEGNHEREAALART